jgi:beta-N-acetylglucosaminidase
MLLVVTCLLASFSFYIDTKATDTIGVVRFESSDDLVDYVEVDSGRTGYFNCDYAGDAAYIRTESSGGREYVICKLAGVVMRVDKQQFVKGIVSYQDQKISYYSVKDNTYLMHNYTYYSGTTLKERSICIGYKPGYLMQGIKYYSYDGHYFYTQFDKMISDYRNNTYANAVNVNAPYYNYYQYLSMHSTANCTPEQYNAHVASKVSSSKMLTTGSAFVATQNKYTINSLLMFGVAGNESAWGTSDIANSKNNLFGLNAVDSNTGNADVFKSVEACIEDFAYGWIHKGYLSGRNWKYRGPHLGDKRSGINVKYASDPYWGEKAAANCFEARNSDYGRYTLGIVRSNIINFYKEADTSSNVIYTSDASDGSYIYDFPVTILEKVTNARGELFYKVASDMSLNADRSARDEGYDPKSEKKVAVYDSNRDYVFVRANDVKIVFENGANITIPETNGQGKTHAEVLSMMKVTSVDNYLTGFAVGSDVSTEIAKVRAVDSSIQIVVKNSNGAEIAGGTIATGMIITITTNGSTVNYSVVVRGDLNGDGKMSALDYVKIRNYLDGASSLSGAYLKSADTSGDGKVTALDYVKVRNHLDGKTAIVQ